MDPFSEAVQNLIDHCKEVSATIFADLDGEPIAQAYQNDVNQNEIATLMNLCAAMGGIALGRLHKMDGGQTDHFIISGPNGHFITMAIIDNYHFSAFLRPGSLVSAVLPIMRKAAEQIRANI